MPLIVLCSRRPHSRLHNNIVVLVSQLLYPLPHPGMAMRCKYVYGRLFRNSTHIHKVIFLLWKIINGIFPISIIIIRHVQLYSPDGSSNSHHTIAISRQWQHYRYTTAGTTYDSEWVHQDKNGDEDDDGVPLVMVASIAGMFIVLGRGA